MKVALQIAGASLAVMSAAPAMAQSSQSASNAQAAASSGATGDIIVTAQRRAERLQDVPISITAISGDKLQEADVQNLGDIAKLSPATRFDYQTNFVQPTIRGVGSSVVSAGAGSNVGIYEDGFYSPNPLAGDFQLLNVSGVQVLKGPQGTLFGRNTTGGAILVTTDKPSEQTSAIFDASYGSFNTVRTQGYVTGGIAQNVAADLEGSYERGDGYIHNIVANGPQHPGEFENWSVRAGVNVDLSNKVSLLFRYEHQHVDDGTNTAVAVLQQNGVTYATFQNTPMQLPASLVPTGYRQVTESADSPTGFHLNSNVYQLTGKADLGLANLTSYTQYRQEDSTVFEDQDQTAADVSYNEIPVHDRTFSQEFLLNSKAGGRLQWTAGAFYFNYVDGFYPLQLGTSAAFLYGLGHSHSRSESIAAYADLTYQLTDKLFLTAGARYSHDKFDQAHFDLSIFGNTIINQSYPTYSANSVTPRAVLRYALDGHSSIYASYTRGYKAGLVDVIAGGTVKPETMDAFEVGYKHSEHGLTISLASWYYNYRNLQVSVYEKGLSEILNAANARIYGAEGELDYAVTPYFQINASAAYLNAKYRSFPTDANFVQDPSPTSSTYGQWVLGADPSSGLAMQRAPKFTATVGVRYGLDAAGGRLNLSGNLYYTSKFYFDPADQFYQNAYALLGLRAEWVDPSKRLTLAVYGDNVTGTKYYSQVLAHSPSIGTVWGAPATWGVSVRVKY